MLFKKHPKLFITLLILLVLCMAGTAGYILAQNEPRIAGQEDTAEPSSVLVDADTARISASAVVTWDYVYSMCGHHVYVEKHIDKSLAGLTFSALKEALPDVRVISFDTEQLVLQKTFDCYCPSHYILKQHEDALAVYRTSPGTDEQYIYLDIQIPFSTLTPDQQQVLSVGRVFGSLSDLEHYLEDIET